MSGPDSPLIVVVSGGGPVGLTFSLNLAMMMGRHAKIIIYEGRWFVDQSGVTRWQGEDQGKTRRDQVVTLQDHVIQQLPVHIQKGLFRNIDEQVWPTSRNIPIREVEDRLFELVYPFVQHGQIELVPEPLEEQSEILIKGNFDVLVGADGANSFVRRYCNIQMISEGLEYACGVAYNIPKEVAPADEPLHQALNCILTVSQTRYLVNSSNSRRGYLNIRLIQSEYDELRERLLAFQSRNEAIDLMDYDKCPQSPVWSIIRQGLDFFRIAPKFVFRVVPIEINVRHASIVVREMRFQVEEPSTDADNKPKKNQYKTALAFLVGDAALNVHFWPGRGMNSGMKAAMALARNIVRSCLLKDVPYTIQPRKPLRFLDFLDYEGFMARLRAREQQGRSLRVLIDPIDKSVEASYSYAHLNHCYTRYINELKEKLKKTRHRLQERPEWPHQSRPVTDEEFNAVCNRISHSAVAQLSLANPWPTREMGGVEILVQDTFPYDPAKFLPVPALSKRLLISTPSIPGHRRYVSLWIIGQSMTDHMAKLIADTKALLKRSASSSQSRIDAPMREDASIQFTVVNTIKEARDWIVRNRQAIRQADTRFKVVTVWSISEGCNAIDVIRAVRGEEPRVPVLIYTTRREEVRPALEFPNITATDLVFNLYEFIGINQETQWNGGCRALQSSKAEALHRDQRTDDSKSLDSNAQTAPTESGTASASSLALSDAASQTVPVLVWIDTERNETETIAKLRHDYPRLKIHFVPKFSEVRGFIEGNSKLVRTKSTLLIICRSFYKSESKTAIDVFNLLREFGLGRCLVVYTSGRSNIQESTSKLPASVPACDEAKKLLTFIYTFLQEA